MQEFVGNIVGVAFSPDGHLGHRRLLRPHDPALGPRRGQGAQEVRGARRMPQPRGLLAADGHHAASASWDRTIRLWDLDAGKELRKFEGHTGVVFGLAFAADGRRLVSGGWDHTARLWDVATGKELRKLEGHAAEVGDVAFSSDGRRVLTGSNDQTLRLWDLESGRELAGTWTTGQHRLGRRPFARRPPRPPRRTTTTSPSGTSLQASRSSSSRVMPIRSRACRSHPTAARPSPPDATACCGSGACPPCPPARGRLPAPAPRRSPPPGRRRCWRRPPRPAGGSTPTPTATGSGNSSSRSTRPSAAAPALTEIETGTDERPSRFAKVVLNSQRLGFDGVRFKAPATGPRRDMQWEFIMPAVENDRGRTMKSWYIMALSGDMMGFRNYVLGDDQPIEGVDLPKKFHVVQNLVDAQVRPGNEYLIWFSFELDAPAVPSYVKIDLVPPAPETQKRLDATAAALRRTFELPESACGLGISRDGHTAYIAAGSSVSTGDVESGRVQKRWDGPAGNVRTVAFAPDGKHAAAGCGDGKILIVDLDAGKELRPARGTRGPFAAWRSCPTASGSSRAPRTTRHGSGTRPRASRSASSRATPTRCSAWPSPPTATASPRARASATRWRRSGHRHRQAPRRGSRGTPRRCTPWRSRPTARPCSPAARTPRCGSTTLPPAG